MFRIRRNGPSRAMHPQPSTCCQLFSSSWKESQCLHCFFPFPWISSVLLTEDPTIGFGLVQILQYNVFFFKFMSAHLLCLVAVTLFWNIKVFFVKFSLLAAKGGLLFLIQATFTRPSLSLTGGIYLALLGIWTHVINNDKKNPTQHKYCKTLHNPRWQVKQ